MARHVLMSVWSAADLLDATALALSIGCIWMPHGVNYGATVPCDVIISFWTLAQWETENPGLMVRPGH